MKGTVFDIQRCSVGDGPGIRTTIFFKGCPLRCQWCHNPEGWQPEPQLRFNARKCLSCGTCKIICPINCRDPYDPKKCIACGLCSSHCHGSALEICGKKMEAEEVIRLALRDQAFYQVSGGGITFSGGEPLMQFDFLLSLCILAKEQGLDICLETSGYAPYERLAAILPYISCFLYDIKETDDALHQDFTGVSNVLILENLKKLNAQGAHIILRCPIIPGCNDRKDHFISIGQMAQSLQHVSQVHLEPYHPLGAGKRSQLSLPPQREFSLPLPDEIEQWLQIVRMETEKEIRLA